VQTGADAASFQLNAPAPGADQVLIRVYAAAVNLWWKRRRRLLAPSCRPYLATTPQASSSLWARASLAFR
jgi:hypothetical protein